MFIDTHTHLYDEWLLPDAEEAIARAKEAGVGKMIQPDVDSRERDALFRLNDAHPGVLYPMIGLYPGSVDARWQEEIDLLPAYRNRGIVAVGEIGLDYHEGIEFKQQQKEALRVQLEMAAEWDLPVNIHLRDAWEDLFSILSDCRHLGLRGNLHCFTSSYEIYRRARQYGDFSVGIGGVVTFKNASVAEAVRKIPMEHILLETDAPYLAPVPHRGKRCDSSMIPLAAEKLAALHGISVQEMLDQTAENARRLFSVDA